MLGEYLGAGSGITKGLWHLNGNSNDSSGNGNNGTDSNITYGLAYGKLGQGASFNGSSSLITLPSIISGTGDATFVMWIKTTENNKAFLSKRDNNNTGIFVLRVGNSTLNFWDYNGSAFQFNPSSTGSTTINDGSWHMVGFTRIGTAGKYYVDGKLDGTTTAASNLSWNTQAIRIARDVVNNEYTNLITDEIIIEGKAWSDADFKKYYTYSKGRFGII